MTENLVPEAQPAPEQALQFYAAATEAVLLPSHDYKSEGETVMALFDGVHAAGVATGLTTGQEARLLEAARSNDAAATAEHDEAMEGVQAGKNGIAGLEQQLVGLQRILVNESDSLPPQVLDSLKNIKDGLTAVLDNITTGHNILARPVLANEVIRRQYSRPPLVPEYATQASPTAPQYDDKTLPPGQI